MFPLNTSRPLILSWRPCFLRHGRTAREFSQVHTSMPQHCAGRFSSLADPKRAPRNVTADGTPAGMPVACRYTTLVIVGGVPT